MPEQVQDLGQLAARLSRLAGEGMPSTQVAEVVVGAWAQIDAALTPVVGRRAVAMLHQRSLFLTAAAHRWLSETTEGLPETMDLDGLGVLLGQQTSVDAAAGGGASLQTFQDLLASLVGSPLTERLLRSIWANSLSGPAAKDTPP